MSLLSYAFLTVDEVQRWLRLPTPTTDELTVIEQVVNSITDRCEQEIGRQIVARDVTEYLDGSGEASIQAGKFPVVSVSLLKALDPYGSTLYTYDHATVTTTPWGRITLSGGVPFMRGEGNIQITYSQGWGAAAAVPQDLKLAALQWVADVYSNWTNKRDPIQSVSIGGQTTTFFDEEIPKRARAVLNRYAIPGASA